MDYFQIGERLQSITVKPSMLFLDPHNPRFKGEKGYSLGETVKIDDPKVQDIVLKFLISNNAYSILELKTSISKVGFLPMDRIVVRKFLPNKFVVLEGNRRVAAIQSLLKDADDRRVTLYDFVSKSIDEIEVLELTGEDIDETILTRATWFLQGVRHISGIKKWGPYQQAELIKQFKDNGVNFTDAGQAVGVGRIKAGRMMRAYSALNQMQNDEDYMDRANPDMFSYFEQAVSQQIIRNWLGWDEDESKFTNKTNLIRFYELITPNDNNKIELIARDVRDRLPYILESSDALTSLMSGSSVEFCYAIAMSQRASAPTWHTAVIDTTKKLRSIPWSYNLNAEDIKMLNDLEQTLSELIAAKGSSHEA